MDTRPTDTSFRVKQLLLFLLLPCLLVGVTHCGGSAPREGIVQEPLHYDPSALEPYISAETIALHFDKHHAGYVANANRLLSASPFKGKSAEEIIRATAGNKSHEALFNNVAQAWNHAFFWKSITPGGGGEPTGVLGEKLVADFGSYGAFKQQFLSAAKAQFGSGWVWLVQADGRLAILTTANAQTPLERGLTPLLVVDLWEHAYYLDYRNRRGEFVDRVLSNLINWDFAASCLKPAAEAHE